jgi:plastocyanin domain-containing protein
MNKMVLFSVVVTLFSLGGIVYLFKTMGSGAPFPSVISGTVVDGTQVIEVRVKGGYAPRFVVAKANTPTVLRMKTQGTFDCSSALVIPSLGYRKNLPASGVTDIEVPPQTTGTSLKGVCAMGMYSFLVNFQ